MTNNDPQLNLAIDPLQLEKEWQRHPREFHLWAKMAADASAAVDEAKSALELAVVELENSVRQSPVDYDLDKVTEKAIENAVKSQPEYKAAVRNLNRAKHRQKVLDAAVNALEHRKRALTMLVELWIRDYYADSPRRPEDEQSNKESVRLHRRQRAMEQRSEGDD